MFNRFVNYGKTLVLPSRPSQPKVQREKREKATLQKFYHDDQKIEAFTRSEARAQLKAKLGIPRKGRLPAGVFAGKA